MATIQGLSQAECNELAILSTTALRPILVNFKVHSYTDDKGKPTTADIPMTPDEILTYDTAQTGQPKNLIADNFIAIGESLYLKNGLIRITNDQHFVATVKNLYQLNWRFGQCDYNNNLFVTLVELQTFIKQVVPHYEATAIIPHVPAMPEIYYQPWAPAPKTSDGPKKLLQLIRKLWANIPNDNDHCLILAMLMMPMWGGKAGQRPAFVMHSQQKRNTGKTSLMDTVINLYGDIPIRFDARGNARREDHFLKDLLSPMAAHVRIVRIDNMTATKDRELAEFITTPIFSGHKMYEGAACRQNRFSWFLTINAPFFDSDLATRAFLISFNTPTPEQRIAWIKNSPIINNNKHLILSEIYHLLNNPPTFNCTVPPNGSRFGDFIKEVLPKCCESQKQYEEIIAKHEKDTEIIDVEDDILDTVLGRIACETQKTMWISSEGVAGIWNKAHKTDHETGYINKCINGYIANGRIKCLIPKRRKYGAGYTFLKTEWEKAMKEIDNDLG